MTESKHTLEGVSSLTVRNGDTTLFLDVDDFTIEVKDEHDDVEVWSGYDKYTFMNAQTYSIRGSTIPLNEEGYAFKVVQKKTPVVRRATIEIEEWTVAQINAARIAVGAPEDAIPTYLRADGKHHVEFKWEESA